MTTVASGPVLVIDDHPLNRKLLERVLALDGYRTLSAGSIAQAEALLAGTDPALIILDICLPDGDGLELARRLKSHPTRAGCPIIACSAGPAPEEARRALDAGCQAYVGKPIEIGYVSELVAGLMAPALGRHVAS